MAVNDVYQLRLFGTYGSSEWSNVFFYQQLTQAFAGEQSPYLAALFDTEILPLLKVIQNVNVLYGGVEVVCMANLDDYTMRAALSESGGVVAGDGYPSRVAMQYKATRPGIGYRSGFKRFVGASESQAAGNQWTPNAAAAYALGAAMTANLDDGDEQFSPVIVKHPVQLGLNPVVRYHIFEWIPQLYLSSQVSRNVLVGGVVPAP